MCYTTAPFRAPARGSAPCPWLGPRPIGFRPTWARERAGEEPSIAHFLPGGDPRDRVKAGPLFESDSAWSNRILRGQIGFCVFKSDSAWSNRILRGRIGFRLTGSFTPSGEWRRCELPRPGPGPSRAHKHENRRGPISCVSQH